MTAGVSRQIKGLTDSNTGGCIPKNSTEDPKLRYSQVNPRRRSLRLMAINGIYTVDDASDSKFQQQTSADNSQHGANQKYETSIMEQSYMINNVYSADNNQHVVNQRLENPIGQGHKINNGYSEDCGDKESSMDSDDLIILGVTLKDMRTRCKARKQKNLKSGSSSASDLESKQTFLKPKEEEEPDLDEPLINLKSKLSNKCSTGRKRRKCSHSSESFVPIKETAAQTSSNTLAHWSSPIKASRISSKKELAAARASNKNLKLISQKDPLHAGSSEMVYDVKCETTDNCLCDVQIVDNCAVTSTAGFSAKCHVLDTSSVNSHQNVNGELGNGVSCCFTSNTQSPCVYDFIDIDMASYNPSRSFSVMGTHVQVDSLEPANVVKSETSEVVPVSCETEIYVSHSSTENFIAKSSYSGNSTSELLEIVDEGASKSGGPPYLTREPLLHGIDRVSSELKEPDNNTCPPESTEDHFGEIQEMESSDIYCHKHSPWLSGPENSSCCDHFELISATEDLSPDACDAIENQTSPQKETEDDSMVNEKNYFSATDSQESIPVGYNGRPRRDSDFCNQVDVAIINMQSCSLQNNVADEHSLLSGEKSDLKFVYSRLEGDCLDKLVLEAFAGDSLTKGYKDDNLPQTEDFSSPDTYNVETCTSSFHDLHDVESLHKNEAYSSTLEEMVNGYRKKATSSKLDDKLSSAEEIKAYDHSHQVTLPLPSALNGFQDMEDSLCKVTEKRTSSLVDEELHPTAELPNYPFEKSYSTDDEGQQEFDCVKGVKEDQPPKKLLSNRKNFSPTSQEKLLQALKGDALYDNQKLSDYGEAEVMMSSNRVSKRMKSSMIGSPLPVTQGILRSPDKPNSTCSCTKSTLMHTQAQKAIKFTQRQMQDIESIASKLLKELKSMKNIVEVCLSTDECPNGPPKFTREEIRIAKENASGLETRTRKWLSMMSKDSTRFCKIMRSVDSTKATEDKVAATVNGLGKRRKKITFADEAGGLLCHVKCFEQQPASFEERLGPISEA